MPRSERWMSNGGAKRMLVQGLYEDTAPGTEIGHFDHYRDWLIKMGGPQMRRAILKAADRYQALKPVQIRASALHRAYRDKRR